MVKALVLHTYICITRDPRFDPWVDHFFLFFFVLFLLTVTKFVFQLLAAIPNMRFCNRALCSTGSEYSSTLCPVRVLQRLIVCMGYVCMNAMLGTEYGRLLLLKPPHYSSYSYRKKYIYIKKSTWHTTDKNSPEGIFMSTQCSRRNPPILITVTQERQCNVHY